MSIHTHRSITLKGLWDLITDRTGSIQGRPTQLSPLTHVTTPLTLYSCRGLGLYALIGVDGVGVSQYEAFEVRSGKLVQHLQAWICRRVEQHAGGDRCQSECLTLTLILALARTARYQF